MGQRSRILTEILGFDGWRVKEAFHEDCGGRRVAPVARFAPLRGSRLVLVVERRWAPRCSACGARCTSVHELGRKRRWQDLPWAEHDVFLEYAPVRLECRSCGATPVEMVAWAEPRQTMTRRLQQRIAIDAAAAPTSRVAERYGLSWGAVRRAEKAAIGRWEATRSPVPLVQVGVDEKWLGRRHRLDHKFVTIVSNLETGEPIWIGRGRNKAILAAWLAGLSDAEKQGIDVFALDMYGPFLAAIEEAKGLEHAAVVHDPFHILKRVGEAIDDARRDVFFRAGPDQRAVGRGARWLLLRAWERNSAHQRAELAALLACNAKLARAYQLKEQIRHLVVHAPDALAMHVGLKAVLRRTQRSSLPAIRKLGDALEARWPALLRLADHRPPTGRIEALNNNWEALVRRSRGCRDHDYLLRKLRFMIANPLRSLDGLRGFVALGQAA